MIQGYNDVYYLKLLFKNNQSYIIRSIYWIPSDTLFYLVYAQYFIPSYQLTIIWF